MITFRQYIENINPKILIIMRALPGAGKSHSVHSLLRQYGGDNSHVFSTDNYWIPETLAKKQAGAMVNDEEEKAEYIKNYDNNKSQAAHANNLKKFKLAVDQGITPIIVDNTNIMVQYMQPYAEYANKNGYKIIIKYPQSEWWKQNYNYLSNKQKYKNELAEFAKILADKNTHDVPLDVIQTMIAKWHHNPTMDEILKGKRNK
jgi:hypothetical protein